MMLMNFLHLMMVMMMNFFHNFDNLGFSLAFMLMMMMLVLYFLNNLSWLLNNNNWPWWCWRSDHLLLDMDASGYKFTFWRRDNFFNNLHNWKFDFLDDCPHDFDWDFHSLDLNLFDVSDFWFGHSMLERGGCLCFLWFWRFVAYADFIFHWYWHRGLVVKFNLCSGGFNNALLLHKHW